MASSRRLEIPNGTFAQVSLGEDFGSIYHISGGNVAYVQANALPTTYDNTTAVSGTTSAGSSPMPYGGLGDSNLYAYALSGDAVLGIAPSSGSSGGIGGGSGSAYVLGPTKNAFDVGSGSLADAQASLDSYTAGHSGWVAFYDDYPTLQVMLLYTEGGEDAVSYASRADGAWRLTSTVKAIRGSKGDTGDPGPKGDTGDPGPKGDKGDPGSGDVDSVVGGNQIIVNNSDQKNPVVSFDPIVQNFVGVSRVTQDITRNTSVLVAFEVLKQAADISISNNNTELSGIIGGLHSISMTLGVEPNSTAVDLEVWAEAYRYGDWQEVEDASLVIKLPYDRTTVTYTLAGVFLAANWKLRFRMRTYADNIRLEPYTTHTGATVPSATISIVKV